VGDRRRLDRDVHLVDRDLRDSHRSLPPSPPEAGAGPRYTSTGGASTAVQRQPPGLMGTVSGMDSHFKGGFRSSAAGSNGRCDALNRRVSLCSDRSNLARWRRGARHGEIRARCVFTARGGRLAPDAANADDEMKRVTSSRVGRIRTPAPAQGHWGRSAGPDRSRSLARAVRAPALPEAVRWAARDAPGSASLRSAQ